MASSGQKGGYMGYFIAGGLVASAGGSLFAVGLIFMWLGYTFPDLMGTINGVPAPVSGVFITLGFGFTIGGFIPLIVGLVLVGTGFEKRRRDRIAASRPSAKQELTPPAPGHEHYHEVAGVDYG